MSLHRRMTNHESSLLAAIQDADQAKKTWHRAWDAAKRATEEAKRAKRLAIKAEDRLRDVRAGRY